MGSDRKIAGVDEVGRGPLAGPVLTCAVILNIRSIDPGLLEALDDSKRLSRPRRELLARALADAARCNHLALALGAASVAEIEQLNILQATLLAMKRAVSRLIPPPDLVLVDGPHVPQLACPRGAITVRGIVGGDRLSASIAAASIIAKVKRDHLMALIGRRYPDYGFGQHAGYGTAAHRAALMHFGPSPHHRRSFAPVRNIC